ncbi:hypothetical protein B0H16DRAFT_128090 [Mycena metata]|uniref:Uncharacterized protein n=1 Tax=Mycena metata TaxID=1033252 RepID=A0AAD7MWW1_9AGAR|nr:hypothetical protein B0H16DRAFT_128090 [Mycena metata]
MTWNGHVSTPGMHCISGQRLTAYISPAAQRYNQFFFARVHSFSSFLPVPSSFSFITVMAGRVFQLLVVGAGLAQIALASPMPAILTLMEPAGVTGTVSASIAGVDSDGATTYILTESAQTATVVAGPARFAFNDGIFDLACEGGDGTARVCTIVPPPDATSTAVFTLPAGTTGLKTMVLDVAAAPTGKPNSAGRRLYTTGLIVVPLSLAALFM